MARRIRIYFATDVHGSEKCFRKFLNGGSVYQPDVLILGGDIAGKAIQAIETSVPAISRRRSAATATTSMTDPSSRRSSDSSPISATTPGGPSPVSSRHAWPTRRSKMCSWS